MDTYVALLCAGAALFEATNEVSRSEFRQFVGHLELRNRFPGMLGIGFSARFSPAQREAIEAAMHRQGDPRFRVWPPGPIEGMYDSILYLEPLDTRNARA